MKNAITSIEDYESLLDRRERELIVQREKVWRFLNKDHSSLDVRKYQIQVRKTEMRLGRTLRELMDDNGVASQFRGETKALCERIRALSFYTKSMDDALCHDLLEKHLLEDEKKIDVIKTVSFFVAVPVAFMTAMKDGLFGGHGNLFEAAGAGIGVGTMFVARKRVANAFRSVGRSVCDAPHRVKNSYFLFYTRQTLREKAAVAEAAISDPAGFVSAVVKRGTGNGKVATFQKPQL
jgi:hypothetical protein